MAKAKKAELRQDSKKELMAVLDAKFGKGLIRPMGEVITEAIPRIPSTSISLNRALNGGLPLGRLVEIYGVNSGGKTTLTLDFLKNAQALGDVAFVDAEHSLDLEWAKFLGIDTDKMWFSQPSCGEEAIEVVRALVTAGTFKLIVVDSVAALVPKSELEGDIGEAHMGKQPRLMAQACRILKGLCDQYGCTVIFINQTRKNMSGYGATDVTTGGEALKFFADVRIEIKIVKSLRDDDKRGGHISRITAIKNKCGKAYEFTDLTVKYGIGFDFVNEILTLAINAGLAEKSGSWYEYDGKRIQGEDAMVGYLRENPEVLTKLTDQVILKGV